MRADWCTECDHDPCINSALNDAYVSAASVPVASWKGIPHCRLALESDLYVDLSKLCEQCDDKKGDVEEEEEDPVRPTKVEPAQWNYDEGQDQG